jgi:hypothetical protein
MGTSPGSLHFFSPDLDALDPDDTDPNLTPKCP